MMYDLRLFACGMAIGASVKYKHVKVSAYELQKQGPCV